MSDALSHLGVSVDGKNTDDGHGRHDASSGWRPRFRSAVGALRLEDEMVRAHAAAARAFDSRARPHMLSKLVAEVEALVASS